jgi:hypothetical protein
MYRRCQIDNGVNSFPVPPDAPPNPMANVVTVIRMQAKIQNWERRQRNYVPKLAAAADEGFDMEDTKVSPGNPRGSKTVGTSRREELQRIGECWDQLAEECEAQRAITRFESGSGG